MKETSELVTPEDLRYSPDHEWVRAEGDRIRVGITDYAQDQLGDVVFVELPQIGSVYETGQAFGVVESVKAVSDLLMPVGGEVVEVNDALGTAPQLVNQSPYDHGWMVVVRASNLAELDRLLTSEKYAALVEETA